jgi:RNA polymerase sigma factor FliA
MSRRIPGREPALVGSVPLRSCPPGRSAGPHHPGPGPLHPAPATGLRPAAAAEPASAVSGTSSGSAAAAASASTPPAAPVPTEPAPMAALRIAEPPHGETPGDLPGRPTVTSVGALPRRSAPRPSAVRAATPTRAEIDDLWATYVRAPSRSLQDRLVVHYTPLVRSVAHRVAAGLPSHVEHADLVQSGVFGLIDAVRRFDPDRCPRFESYATQRIRGAILDELRAQDWVPRSVRGRARELERAQERLENRLRRGATDRELAAELGVPVRDLVGLTRQLQLVSVEALCEGSGGVSELLTDGDAPDPMAVVQARETLRQLSVAVGQLGERDQTVIRLYYLENRTLAEIGLLLGVTESRVCQLHTRLVGRLRGRLEELAAG